MELDLYDAPVGARLTLVGVPQELRGLGFIPGAEVSVLLRTRGGVSVRLGELTFALCRELARKVTVRRA
jgi:Fe2+ transport system protein FeoA